MQRIKNGFLVVVGLITMSFTIALNSKKKQNMSNCYRTIITCNYLSNCSLPDIWTAVSCSNKGIGAAVKNDLNVSNFTSSTVVCSGTSILCCINFKDITTNPCPNTTALSKGDDIIKDFNGNTIPPTSYLIINDVGCKN
jgi:hypothetical protein